MQDRRMDMAANTSVVLTFIESWPMTRATRDVLLLGRTVFLFYFIVALFS